MGETCIGDNMGEAQKAFFADVAEFGRQSGVGSTALSNLAVRVIEAAKAGLIEPYNANRIYNVYVEASKNAGGTPGSIKSNVSKLRKIIELGTRFRESDTIVDDVARIRDELPNPKSLFEGLVDIARRRIERKRKLSDDEIRKVLTKAPKRPAAVNSVDGWQTVAEKVKKLVATNNKDGIETAIAIRDQIDSYITGVEQ
jgi:hypothetical protein